MYYTDFTIEMTSTEMLGKAMMDSTPKKYARLLLEGAEIIRQLRKERDEARAKPDDVRSVVLCSKCRYCQKEDEYTLWCTGFCNPSRLVRPDDFCSHGEAEP